MTITEAIKYFKNQAGLAEALGVTPGMITQIKTSGEIPEKYQWKIQGITNGALKVDKKYRPAA
jgi:hypothetical protein